MKIFCTVIGFSISTWLIFQICHIISTTTPNSLLPSTLVSWGGGVQVMHCFYYYYYYYYYFIYYFIIILFLFLDYNYFFLFFCINIFFFWGGIV